MTNYHPTIIISIGTPYESDGPGYLNESTQAAMVNEVCDNCGSPLIVVRSREGRFCTSECAEAFELS